MSEWISVDEQELPKDGRVVIAWRFFPVAIRWNGNKEYPWDAVHLGGYNHFMINGFMDNDPAITHWLRLESPNET